MATTAALLGRPDPAAAARVVPTGYGVAVEPRSTWAGDSRPMRGNPPDEDVRFLLVHHTAGPSQGDPIQLIRQVYDFHTGAQRGWPDIAYNFLIEPGGRVFEARDGSLDRAVEASATGGNQGFAQLVCLLGDFTNRIPTDAQLRSLNGTLAWLADRYAISTSPGATATFVSRGSNTWPEGTQVTADTISGHREMSATACPGDAFFPYLKDRVRTEVDALRGQPGGSAQETSTAREAVPATSSPPSTLGRSTGGSSSASSVPSTVASQPPSTITLPTTNAADTTTTIRASTVPTTVPTTVADGPVVSPPAPQADELAVDAPEPGQAGDGQTTTSVGSWGLAAGAAAIVAAAATYVGLRGRFDDADDFDAEPNESNRVAPVMTDVEHRRRGST